MGRVVRPLRGREDSSGPSFPRDTVSRGIARRGWSAEDRRDSVITLKNALRLRAIGSILLCAVSLPARSSEPSTKPVISEGNYIGYATVADALATLKARGLMALPAPDGSVEFVEPDNKNYVGLCGERRPSLSLGRAVRIYEKRRGAAAHNYSTDRVR
jgi:hypothetical protein